MHIMDGGAPLQILEDSELYSLLTHNQLDQKSFIKQRQIFLRQHVHRNDRSSKSSWPLRPIYQNMKMVQDYHDRVTSTSFEIKRLQGINDLLERIGKLDNHIQDIKTRLNEMYSTMQSQQGALEKKLAVLKRTPGKDEQQIIGLKKAYEASWRSLKHDLRAQRDVLAIEGELRSSFLKELKIICERGPANGEGRRRSGMNSSR